MATISEMGRSLDVLVKYTDPHVYHFEYTALHNQRIAVVRLIHLWHQIAFPASLTIFGFLANLATSRSNNILLILALIFAALLLLFARVYSRTLDIIITDLYPRIITLELLLDYRFYRDYLRQNQSTTKAISECEKLDCENTASLNEEVSKILSKDRPAVYSRGHLPLDIAAALAVMSFILFTILLWNPCAFR